MVWVKNLFEFMKITATAYPGNGKAASHFLDSPFPVVLAVGPFLSVTCPLLCQEHLWWCAHRVLHRSDLFWAYALLLGPFSYAFAKQ